MKVINQTEVVHFKLPKVVQIKLPLTLRKNEDASRARYAWM